MGVIFFGLGPSQVLSIGDFPLRKFRMLLLPETKEKGDDSL
jgi:hypothetical protein